MGELLSLHTALQRKGRTLGEGAHEPSNAELVGAIVEGGSVRAREIFYRRHAPMVLGMAHRLLGGSEVEDVVQDTFVEAFAKLHRLRERESVRSWLGSICVTRVRRRLRKRRMLRRLGFHGDELSADSMVSAGASPEVTTELRAIGRVIGGLDPEERIALLLRRVEGMTLPEVAVAMGVSESTAKRRVRDATDVLARSYAEGGR